MNHKRTMNRERNWIRTPRGNKIPALFLTMACLSMFGHSLTGQAAQTQTVKEEPPKIEVINHWDLGDIYKDWTAWETAGTGAEETLETLSKLKGKLASSPATMLKALKLKDEASSLYYRLQQYLRLRQDSGEEDKGTINKRWQLVIMLRNNIARHSGWVLPEIMEIPYQTVSDWIKQTRELAPYQFLLEDLFRRKPYRLPRDKQEVLFPFTRFFNSPVTLYRKLTGDDFRPLTISLNSGKPLQITLPAFQALIGTATPGSEQVLEDAFKAFYKSHRATLASFIEIFNSICYLEAANAAVHGFQSSLQWALHAWNVPTGVYENLLKMARAGSKPLQRYIDFRKSYFKLKEHHVFNMPVPLSTVTRSYDYKTASAWVQAAALPLGKEYGKYMKKAFKNGWLQVVKKSKGAPISYTGHIYGVHAYGLVEDTGGPNFVFNLSKQLNRMLMLDLAATNQNYAYSTPLPLVQDTITYLHYRLMLDQMLKADKSPKNRAAYLDSALRRIVGSYYMPSMQSEMELQAHNLVSRGTPLNEETLKNLSQEQFKGYFKDSMAYDDFLDIYWVQRHSIFTAPFTAYQRAAAIAAGTKLYIDLTTGANHEKKLAEERILKLIKAGSNGYPIDLLKAAGANLNDPTTFLSVGRDMDNLITQLEIELKK